MKRTEPMRLGDIIQKMVDATGLRPQYSRRSVEAAWPDVVGPHIAAYTGRVYVKDRTLYVHIVSAPLKEEMTYLHDLLVRQLNEAAGADVISNIRFL